MYAHGEFLMELLFAAAVNTGLRVLKFIDTDWPLQTQFNAMLAMRDAAPPAAQPQSHSRLKFVKAPVDELRRKQGACTVRCAR
jgi:hypothetical protein